MVRKGKGEIMVTIDLKLLGWGLVVLCLVILLIFCIVLVKNLIVTVKHTNKVLEDTEVITGIAADRTKELNSAVGDMSKAISGFAEAVKGKQNIVGAVSALVKAFAALKNIASKQSDE